MFIGPPKVVTYHGCGGREEPVVKRKRYPDGRIRKYKARFCVRGDRQRFGIDFDETYAPVVQWSSVRMLFTLALTLGLKTRQVDYSNAFVQADIDGEVYCELPQEFLGPDNNQYVLKLKKSLYGLKQAPRLWFKTLEKSLHDRFYNKYVGSTLRWRITYVVVATVLIRRSTLYIGLAMNDSSRHT